MPKPLTLILCTFLILALLPLTLAEDGEYVNYETAGVGRIVGDSPGELKQQLQKTNLKLDNAAYYGDDTWFDSTEEKVKVLKDQFDDPEYYKDDWYWSYVENEINNDPKNKFLVVEADGRISNSRLIMTDDNNQQIQSTSLSSWSEKLKDSLLLFSVDFAGLFLPKNKFDQQNSLIGQLGGENTIVATSNVRSKEFVRSFICNLKQSRNIGEVMRQARNNYYWGVTDIDNWYHTKDEYIGLTMLSFMLYGNPLSNVLGPTISRNVLEDECPEYLKEFPYAGTTSLSITELATDPLETQAYQGDFTYHFLTSRVIHDQDYELLEISNTPQVYQDNELALPSHLEAHEFPLQTVIQDVSLISFEDSEDVYLNDLPLYYNGTFIDRQCSGGPPQPKIEYSRSSTEDSEVVLVRFFPLEVVDCEEGLFKLYKKVRYRINYLPRSPVLLKSINYEKYLAPGEENTAEITAQNLVSHQTYGTILIKDESSRILGQTNIYLQSAQTDSFSLDFTAPQEDGSHLLAVEYLDEETPAAKSNFIVRINPLLLTLENVPEKINPGEDLSFSYFIKNNHEEEVDFSFTLNLSNSKETIYQEETSLTLPYGESLRQQKIIPLHQDTRPGYYDLTLTVKGENIDKIVKTTILIANLVVQIAPQLEPLSDLTVYQGEKIRLELSARDENGDPLAFTLPAQFQDDLVWQTGKHDSGTYHLEVTASDGYAEDSEEFSVTVLEKDSENQFYDDVNLDNPRTQKTLIYNGPAEQAIYLKILKKADIKTATLAVASTK